MRPLSFCRRDECTKRTFRFIFTRDIRSYVARELSASMKSTSRHVRLASLGVHSVCIRYFNLVDRLGTIFFFMRSVDVLTLELSLCWSNPPFCTLCFVFSESCTIRHFFFTVLSALIKFALKIIG